MPTKNAHLIQWESNPHINNVIKKLIGVIMKVILGMKFIKYARNQKCIVKKLKILVNAKIAIILVKMILIVAQDNVFQKMI